jgi:MOSC domain-containing protein YiiM
MSHVISITYTPANSADVRPDDRYCRVSLTTAELVPDHGIMGDLKGRTGSRQLNVMPAEIVEGLWADGFLTGPGELGEQIVIAGLATAAWTAGVRLRIGGAAIVELTYLRTGCKRFVRIQGKPKDESRGRLGFMAKVVVGGFVAVGDRVEVDV